MVAALCINLQAKGSREIRGDKVIVDLVKAPEPKRRELIQDRALVGNRIWQNHVKRREAIGGDEEQRFSEIKNFSYFPAPQLFDSGKIEKRLWRTLHNCEIITAWLESSSNHVREFCTDTTGFFPAKF